MNLVFCLRPCLRPCLCLLLLTKPFPLAAQTAVSEAQLAEWLIQFPEADLDADGRLTLAEATAYRNSLASKTDPRKTEKIPPTHSDVVYGGHERNRFDLWLPEKRPDDRAVPILVHFHGGGFVAGDKSDFDPSLWLGSGIACVSANYRFVNGTDVFADAPLLDSARVVQTLRARAEEWGIDGGRIALTGGSAGAVISMWIAYHEDLADPEAADPVARQSTRVNCLVPVNGPANLMPDWILKNVGGPPDIHTSFPLMFGGAATEPLTPEVLSRIKEASPWEHVSPDDPPTLLIYTGPLDAVPLPPETSSGKSIHHAAFGKALQKKLEEAGIDNAFRFDFDPDAEGDFILSFLKNHFAMND